MKQFNARCQGGQKYESLTAAQLKQLAASGLITPQDEISQAGSDQWISAAKAKGLFPSPNANSPVYDPPSAQEPSQAGTEPDSKFDSSLGVAAETNTETTEIYSVQTNENVRSGPVDLNQLRVWVNERRISPNDLILFQDGSPPVSAGNWEPLQEYFKGANGDDAIKKIIPYKNKCALIGYYLGVFSIFPVLGLPLAIAALILGVKGLKYRKQNPQAHGKAHSIVAIIGGVFGLLINVPIWLGLVGAMFL